MSKRAGMGAAKGPPGKRRLISQAPPPTTPLPRGSYAAPKNAETDRPSADTLKTVEFGFCEAERHCNEAIGKGRNKRVDHRQWAYWTKRWSGVLRPELEHALTNGRNIGMNVRELAELDRRIKKLDCEWSLVCQLRQSTSSKPVPFATAGQETAAIELLSAHLKSNPDLTRKEAADWCTEKGFATSARGFQSRIWPGARREAGLDAKARAGRKRKRQ
jgi:hypothetical protein